MKRMLTVLCLTLALGLATVGCSMNEPPAVTPTPSASPAVTDQHPVRDDLNQAARNVGDAARDVANGAKGAAQDMARGVKNAVR